MTATLTASVVFRSAIRRCAAAVTFPGSGNYWERRYARGRHSGAGSYGRLAMFKAEMVNAFVADHGVQSVIEFGCGDGNQLGLASYPSYVGLDVSRTAVEMCRQRFSHDPTKRFALYDSRSWRDQANSCRAEVGLSLDVIYHLVEDDVFSYYMRHLFQAATRFVLIYSSNKADLPASPHVRHRQFTEWVGEHEPQWQILAHVPNRYPFDPRQPHETSLADFYFFQRTSGGDGDMRGGEAVPFRPAE